MSTQAFDVVDDLDRIISHMRSTDVTSWQCGVVRSEDGTRNCFFGHLFQWAVDHAAVDAPGVDPEQWASQIWDAFENTWASTFRIYSINDGDDPDYPQENARDRMVAYLEALRDGRELTTQQQMDLDYQDWLARENAAA